jgi:hypothetical protein
MFHTLKEWIAFYHAIKYPLYKQMEKHGQVGSWAKVEKFAIEVQKKVYSQYLKETNGIDKHNLLQ